MERSSNFSSNSVVLTDFNRRSIFKDGTQEQALSFRGRIFSQKLISNDFEVKKNMEELSDNESQYRPAISIKHKINLRKLTQNNHAIRNTHQSLNLTNFSLKRNYLLGTPNKVVGSILFSQSGANGNLQKLLYGNQIVEQSSAKKQIERSYEQIKEKSPSRHEFLSPIKEKFKIFQNFLYQSAAQVVNSSFISNFGEPDRPATINHKWLQSQIQVQRLPQENFFE